MLQLLVLSCILALGVAEPELEPAAAASPVFVNHDERDYFDHQSDHDDDYHSRKGYVSHDDLKKQHRIIDDVFSPDYHEPSVILDYRYQKSGGREYTRGPGGQILILPHNVKSPDHNAHRDYDSLIEFLRLKHLPEHEKQQQRHRLHHDREDGWH